MGVAADPRAINVGGDAHETIIVSGDGNKIQIHYSAAAGSTLERPGTTIGPNPYRGLAAFTERDAEYFFGREILVERLHGHVHSLLRESGPALRLLTVFGPSGCGKSSVVRAGLIPELVRRPAPGCGAPRVALMTPDRLPQEQLATVLARIASGDPTPALKAREFLTVLRDPDVGAAGFRFLAHQLPDHRERPLIVLVDQFEELFTLTPPAQRDAFIEQLTTAASYPDGGIIVVATLRSDYLAALQRHPRLSEAMADPTRFVLVPAMSEDDLRRAVTQPAAAAGHPLDEATVDLLIAQTRDREGALPLLQFTLTRIWEGMAEGAEPAATLRAIGGVGGALAHEAQDLYENLAPDAKRVVRRAFLAMVQVSMGAAATRRRVPLDSIVAAGETAEEVMAIVGAFARPDRRLITVSAEVPLAATEDPAPADVPMLEITHEALLEHWGFLRNWLLDERDDLRALQKLAEAADEWDAADRPEGLLWRPPALDMVQGLKERHGSDLTQKQADFVAACEAAEAERIRNERRRRRRTAAVAFVMTALAILASTAAIIAWNNAEIARQREARAEAARREADEQASLARARELAIRAETVLNGSIGNTSLAGLLAVESLGLAHTIDGQQVLAKVMALTPRRAQPLESPWEWSSFQFSPDGELTLNWRYNSSDWSPASGAVSVVDGSTLEIDETWSLEGRVRPAISPGGAWMAIAGDARRLQVIDLRTRKLAANIRYTFSVDARFSTDGANLFVARADGVLETRVAPDWRLLRERRFANPERPFDGLSLSASAADGPLLIWMRSGAYVLPWGEGPAVSLDASDTVTQFAGIDPTGRRAFTSEWYKVTTLWDPRSGERIAALDHETRVNVAAFSADGSRLATGTKYGDIHVWDTTTGTRLESFSAGKALNTLDFSADGTLLAAGDDGGQATIWNVETLKQVQRWSYKEPVRIVAFGKDGRSLMIAGESWTLRRVDLATGKEVAQQRFPGNVFALDLDQVSGTLAIGIRGTQHNESWTDMRAIDSQSGELKWTMEHNGGFPSLVFSPDGRSFATTTGGVGDLKIWNAETGELRHAPNVEGYDDSLAYTSDGTRLIVREREVVVVDPKTGKKLGMIGEPGGIDEAAFPNPEGALITYGGDFTFRAWNMDTGREVWRRANPDRNRTEKFSQDGRRYVIGRRIFETRTGRLVAELPSARARPIFSRDGRRLLRISLGLRDRRRDNAPYTDVELWDLEMGKRLIGKRFDVLFAYARFLPGDRVQILAPGTGMEVLDARTGAMLWSISDFTDYFWSFSTLPDRPADPLIVGGPDFTEFRDQRTGTVLARYEKALGGKIVPGDPSLMIATDIREAGSGEKGVSLALLDWRTGQERWRIRLLVDEPGKIKDYLFSPDGKRLLLHLGDHPAQLLILDLADGRVLGRLETDSPWQTVWPLPDPDLVLVRDFSDTVRVWRLSTGEEIHRFAHTHTADGVAVATRANRAVTHKQGSLRVWDLDDLSQVSARRTHGRVRSAAIRPDGQQVAYVTDRERKTASGALYDGLVLWEPESDTEPTIIPMETDSGDVTYDPSGEKLAARIGKRTVRAWDVSTLRPLLTVEALPGATVGGISFSADGARLFVYERENAGTGWRIWDIASGRELARVDATELLEVPQSTDLALRHRSGWRRWDVLSGDFETLPWPIKYGSRLRASPDGGAITDIYTDVFSIMDMGSGATRSLRPVPSNQEFTAHTLSAARDRIVFSQRKLDPYRPGAISLRQLPGGEVLAHTTPNAVVTALKFADGDDSVILVGTPGDTAVFGSGTSFFLWRWRSGELFTLSEDQPIGSVAVSPDGARFVTSEGAIDYGEDDERPKTIGTLQLRLWDARTGEMLQTIPLEEPVHDVAFSTDGHYLAARETWKIVLFDITDWTRIRTLDLPGGLVGGHVSFAADNRVIAAHPKNLFTSEPAGIRIWSANGRLEHFLQTNSDFPPLTLSRDGRTLAVRDKNLLQVWDVESGTEWVRQQFEQRPSFVFAGSDDQLFAKVYGSDVLIRIPWRTEELINEACRRLQHQLDEEELKCVDPGVVDKSQRDQVRKPS